MTEQQVLIAGCGDLGIGVAQVLATSGMTVWGLRRRPEPLPEPLRTWRADLLDPTSLALPAHFDTVYYTATPGRFDDEAYRATYVDGLANLIQALRPHPPRRLIFVSSTAVYGQLEGEWVDEASPTEPRSFSGKRVLEAETLAQSSGLAATIVRFGGIYGPGRERMLRKVRAGEPCAAEPPYYTNRIHRDDCIGILAHLAHLEVPIGLYLGVDDAPCTQCELMDYLAGLLGMPRPDRTTAPAGGLRGSNKRCTNAKLKASGYRLRYPTYREGYRAMVVDGA